MNLVSTLASGIAAAPNGTAEIYDRGTSDRSTVYYTFEGATPDSSGADIDLDSYGSVEVYVNALVDIIVRNADGTIVRTFTEGASAPVVEVRSNSFTGINYDTLASAPGNPTTLQAVLDLWNTSSGSIDWKVLLSGTATSLKDAFGALSGLVFNVKSPAYGAIGDGVTNDQAAIQAALAAAVAAGGGIVYFPKGTYLISSAIEWSHKVSIVGVGARLSVITQGSSTNAQILTWTSGTSQQDPIYIAGMGFNATQSNSGDQLYATVSVNMEITACGFGVSSNCSGTLLSLTGGRVSITSSRLDCRGSSGAGYAIWATNAVEVVANSTWFATSNSSYNQELVRVDSSRFSAFGCVFDVTSVSAGPTSLYGIRALSAHRVTIASCGFTTAAQNFTACVRASSSLVTTTGNSYGTSTRYSISGGPLLDGSHLELSAASRSVSSSSPITVPDNIEVFEHLNGGTKPTLVMPAGLFPGQRLQVLLRNISGGLWAAGSPFSGATLGGFVTAPQIPATGDGSYSFVYTDLFTSGTYGWYLYSVI